MKKKLPHGFQEDYDRMRTHLDSIMIGWEKEQDIQFARGHYTEITTFLRRWSSKVLPSEMRAVLKTLESNMAKTKAILDRNCLLDCLELSQIHLEGATATLHLALLESKKETLTPMGQQMFLSKLRQVLGSDDFAESYRRCEELVARGQASATQGVADLQEKWGDFLAPTMRERLSDADVGTVVSVYIELCTALNLAVDFEAMRMTMQLVSAMGKSREQLLEDQHQATEAIAEVSTPRFPFTEVLRTQIENLLEEPEADTETLLRDLKTISVYELVEARMNIHIQAPIAQGEAAFYNLVMRAPEKLLPGLLDAYNGSEGDPFDPDTFESNAIAVHRETRKKYRKLLEAYREKYGEDFPPGLEKALEKASAKEFLKHFHLAEAEYLALEKRYPNLPATTFRRE